MAESLFTAKEDSTLSERQNYKEGDWVFNYWLSSLAVTRMAQFIMEVYTLNNRGALLAMCTGSEDVQHEICLYERRVATDPPAIDEDVHFYGEYHLEIERWEMRCGPKFKDYLDSMRVDTLKTACIPLNIYGQPLTPPKAHDA